MCALIAVLAALAPLQVAGDLGAALRRVSSSGAPAVLPVTAPLNDALVVPLTRVKARSTPEGVTDASFYVATIRVGHPARELTVMFDTSSGNVLMPHRACKSVACVEHTRYSPWESSTAMDVDVNGSSAHPGHRFLEGSVARQGATVKYTQSDFGEGEAKAVFVRDTVCLGSKNDACVDVAMMTATKLEEEPFRAMPNDGIIGLGFEHLSVSPAFSFFTRVLQGSRNVLPQFGMYFGAEKGELHMGGHDLARLASPIHWFPVDHPEDGYWQVAIKEVRVGGVIMDECKRGCHGIVDSGVSRLGVQASNLPKLEALLNMKKKASGACEGPDLTFDLGDMTLTLQARDYADLDCKTQLGSLNLQEPEFKGVYALGASVLRRYYAAFDWQQRQLGFAPLKQGLTVARATPHTSLVVVV
eukprot:TRINITY_DN54720_c0_g1_i1.p1 TRINITY_DN54720_c0_g1~~TRINITY_DN54720_c0_g1_i1.p1  ORF type:complete len:415 (+),score=69.63 TRINITY_DN54720_c0_g1_i1:73-1317(+)